MIIKSTQIDGVKLIYPKYISDKRGFFAEIVNLKKFKSFFKGKFVQENVSFSIKKGTFRGMHFQKGRYAQDKLISVLKGSITDFIFDLRSNSKTYKKLIKINLTEQSNFFIFVPVGCAHGFLTNAHNTIVTYKASNYYNKKSDSGIYYNSIKVKLNKKKITISKKDKNLKSFSEKKKYF